jgi:hypothetical protein
MALGPQFENTYWHDDKGEMRTSILNPTGTKEGEERYRIEQGFSGNQIEDYSKKHNAQGMLFSPETGTGLREDPLVPPSTRISVIHQGLGMSDQDEYAKRAGKKLYFSRNSYRSNPLTPGQAKTATDAYTHALNTSSMPTHLIENHIANNPVLAIGKPGMQSGHYDNGVIRLGIETPSERVRIPEQKTTRTVGGEVIGPISNPKLKEQAKKTRWTNHSNDYVGDILENATITGPMGEQFMQWTSAKGKPNERIYNPEHVWDPETRSYPDVPSVIDNPAIPKFNIKIAPQVQEQLNKEKDLEFDFRNLPEGYSMNVYPGKGNVKNPNIKTTDFTVYNGYHPINNTYRDLTWHTREEVSDPVTEEVTVPSRISRKYKTPYIDQKSVVHELGHHLDASKSDNFSQRNQGGDPDPVEEALADGVADAYSNLSRMYSSRMYTEGQAGQFQYHSGYKPNYWGFTNDTDRALYAAMRAHVSANPDPEVFNQTPSRHALVTSLGIKHLYGGDKQDRNIANQMLLGHLYDSHSHVRKTLDSLGYSDVSKEAQGVFTQQRDKNKPKPFEQPELPGL